MATKTQRKKLSLRELEIIIKTQDFEDYGMLRWFWCDMEYHALSHSESSRIWKWHRDQGRIKEAGEEFQRMLQSEKEFDERRKQFIKTGKRHGLHKLLRLNASTFWYLLKEKEEKKVTPKTGFFSRFFRQKQQTCGSRS